MSRFYEDQVYIEMCRKAEEIQKKHKGKVHGLGTIHINVAKKIEHGIDMDGNFFVGCGKTFIPRLDQLLEMIEISWAKGKPWSIPVMIELKPHCEKMVLGHVMELLYRKTWNGKEWSAI